LKRKKKNKRIKKKEKMEGLKVVASGIKKVKE
jgi:hypothetical protein